MEAHGSYETSWADQWDNTPNTAYVSADQNQKGSTVAKYKQKVGEGFGKTKTVTSHGFVKVKEGTMNGVHWIRESQSVRKIKGGASVGIQWMKAKYQKATKKH